MMRSNSLKGSLSVHLTDREREVVSYIGKGWKSRDIADAMGIGAETVKRHLTNCYRKTQMPNRTCLAIYAMHQGWAAGVAA